MIYLDNAATTFPKPGTVIDEVARCLREYCGNPGRGTHGLSLRAAERIFETREALADFFGLADPTHVVFCKNTTEALAIAISGLIPNGAHVLISELEHNAVYRQIYARASRGELTFDLFPVVGLGEDEVLAGIAARQKKQTRALVCTHASNVCSITLPIEKIGERCKKNGILFIVDAAQSAGRLPISMQSACIDALALPGHKSLYGIQGCGALLLGDHSPAPLLVGGSGVDSLSPEMPMDLPERQEAGTLPTPAIVSLLEGLAFLRQYGAKEIAAQERRLFWATRERLQSLPDIKVFAPDEAGAVLLFSKRGVPAAAVAQALSARGICVRGGLHCAPLAHRALSTPAGGAVRVSFGAFNTLRDVDALLFALRAL